MNTKSKTIVLEKRNGYDYSGASTIEPGKRGLYVCRDFVKSQFGTSADSIKCFVSKDKKRGYKKVKIKQMPNKYHEVYVDGELYSGGESYIYRKALEALGRKKTFWLKIKGINK
jgi:hypothetical protein